MAPAADEKLAEKVASELKRLNLILDADAQTLRSPLAQGTVTMETWLRIAEKALDAAKKIEAKNA
jgi:hypothetical protein